jgi:CheY-like chemotaxis protein
VTTSLPENTLPDENLTDAAELHLSPDTYGSAHRISPNRPGSHLPGFQQRQFRILCVDDDITGTEIRKTLLEHHGYSVVTYHSPLAVIRSDLSSFDLGILDFEMPGLNGRELLLRMRQLGAVFPIMLLSGYARALSRDDQALFDRCLDKTEPTQHLLNTVAELLGLFPY